MLRFVITVATAAACIAGANLANAGGGGGGGALPPAQSTLDYPSDPYWGLPSDAYAYAQKSKKVYIYERISKGPRAEASHRTGIVVEEPIRLFQKPDELYGTACQHPFKTAFSCPGSGM